MSRRLSNYTEGEPTVVPDTALRRYAPGNVAGPPRRQRRLITGPRTNRLTAAEAPLRDELAAVFLSTANEAVPSGHGGGGGPAVASPLTVSQRIQRSGFTVALPPTSATGKTSLAGCGTASASLRRLQQIAHTEALAASRATAFENTEDDEGVSSGSLLRRSFPDGQHTTSSRTQRATPSEGLAESSAGTGFQDYSGCPPYSSRNGNAPGAPDEPRLAMQIEALDVATQPAVATLLREQRTGKGHRPPTEALFMRCGNDSTMAADHGTTTGTAAARLDCSRWVARKDGHGVRDTQLSRTSAAVAAECATQWRVQPPNTAVVAHVGVLEYDDPRRDDRYWSVPGLAHRHRGVRGCKGSEAQRSTPSPRADGADVLIVDSESEVAPSAVAGEREAASSHLARLPRKDLKEKDSWAVHFKPPLKALYDVPPCLGRCGRTDYHATFDQVQAAPNSALYAGSEERFTTTKQVPLCTPSDWQCHRRGRKAIAHQPL